VTSPIPLPLPKIEVPPAFVQEKDFSARQHCGKREEQEDSFAFADASAEGEEPLSRLLVTLGDGLGAHHAGAVASYLAVNSFVRAFHENDLLPAWRLRVALDAANQTLDYIGAKLPSTATPMGTTLLAVLVHLRELHWVSVGDSPLFLYRSSKLQRLNADHSLVPQLQERIMTGELTVAEAEQHPDRHMLQSAVMGRSMPLVDLPSEPTPLRSGDVLIAASDGIFTLDHSQLEEMLAFGRHTTADKIADAILFAIRRINFERQDNVTVAVIKIP